MEHSHFRCLIIVKVKCFQVNTSAFQIPSWMNVENAQSGIITDNSSGLRLGYAPPPIFAAQTLPLATPQRMPQILSPIGQHQVPPILHNPIVPVLPPIHYQQSPFIGVPFIWTPETTQPTQYSSASDSDKKEPSSEVNEFEKFSYHFHFSLNNS